MVKLHSPPNELLFENGRSFSVLATISGILLLKGLRACDNMILIYNPYTRVLKTVPDHYPASSSIRSSVYDVYGFRYGTTLDDLEIVRLRVVDYNTRCCEVFSLKHGSWTTIIPSIRHHTFRFECNRGIFVKGFLYWIICDKNSSRLLLLALDVKEMVFSKIRVPPNCILTESIPLGTLNGRLCFVSYKRPDYELWVMKEIGGVKS
ncbi:F-box/kelch-repeat protein At3g06240-like [Rutidosis leptorrhynchoides]|uniref:F-box/kelch-repeat protein At3g06240-like n=1 Tax=Rutidosis leptorrhynchoides TaxID=125765 RepID=UPI003A994550